MADTVRYPLNNLSPFILLVPFGNSNVLSNVLAFLASLAAKGGHVTCLSNEMGGKLLRRFLGKLVFLMKEKSHGPSTLFSHPDFSMP